MKRLAFCLAAFLGWSAAAVAPEDRMSFPCAWNPTIPKGVETTRPALTTSQKLLYLPRKKSGFGFTSNIEQLAYISPDQVSTIHFQPINASKKPVLHIRVPSFVKLYGGFRDFKMEQTGDVCRFVPGAQASKYTFYWKLLKPMSAGARFTVTYWGEWSQGRQEERPLTVEVVRIPEAKGLKRLPVYWSMPNDFFASYPDFAGLKRCGFNLLDQWSYVEPGDAWGWSLLEETRRKCAEVPGLRPCVWVREWWWEKARASEEGAATLADGTKTHAALCLSYRGEHFRRWLEQGRALIDRGFLFHTADPEIYGSPAVPGQDNATAICHCATCRSAYEKYKAQNPAGTRYDFAARRYADFFREYRNEMESYMKAKNITGKFVFMIYNAYHRSFGGFASHRDYRQTAAYRGTLEDPVYFKGVFDILAPMVYMDVYANYNPYDMLLPWRDVFVLNRIVKGEIPIAPILCAGYPFLKAFDCDLNADMLKWNILEAISGGARGFGFWGECPFDANDMRALSEAVSILAPYEDIIADGRPNEDVRCLTGNAVVKRLDSPRGTLIFVSEYSDRPLDVTVACTVKGRDVRKTVHLGKDRIVLLALPDETGFVPMVRPGTLAGWEGATNAYHATAKGELVCSQEGGQARLGNLWTVRPYTNFIIRFDVKLSEGANNGLGLRARPDAWCARQGMEIQLLDDWSDLYNGTNALKDYQYSGSVYGVVPARRRADGTSYMSKPGEWTSVEVRANGPWLSVALNGTEVVNANIEDFGYGSLPIDGHAHPGLHHRAGRIHWCGHGSDIAWRNIRIKELPSDPGLWKKAAPQTVRILTQGFELDRHAREDVGNIATMLGRDVEVVTQGACTVRVTKKNDPFCAALRQWNACGRPSLSEDQANYLRGCVWAVHFLGADLARLDWDGRAETRPLAPQLREFATSP